MLITLIRHFPSASPLLAKFCSLFGSVFSCLYESAVLLLYSSRYSGEKSASILICALFRLLP